MNTNQTTEQPPELTAERLDRYISQLFANWCENSPYGEQVPDEWPELMAEFVSMHKGKDRDAMAELIAEADFEDPFEKLLESIFNTSCHFVIRDLTEAVHDENFQKLSVIDYSHSASQLHSLRSELATAKERIGELEMGLLKIASQHTTDELEQKGLGHGDEEYAYNQCVLQARRTMKVKFGQDAQKLLSHPTNAEGESHE